MAVLTPDQLTEFVNFTIQKFDREATVNISFDLQEHVAMSKIFDPHKVQKEGTHELVWKVRTSTDGNFKMSSMYGVHKLVVKTNSTEAKVPWRKPQVGWGFDVDEDAFQSGPETIVKQVKFREEGAMQDMAEGLETQIWTAPSGSSENHILGIPYYLVKPTAGQEGFNGGAPSGWTTVANLNPTTYPNWKNYVFDYASIDVDDLIVKWRKASWKTKFKSPARQMTELDKSSYSKYGYYTTYTVYAKYSRLGEARNQNLGFDLAEYSADGQGRALYGGNEVCAVPYLEENDSSNVIYGINWDVMQPVVKTGRYMKRSPLITPDDQPSVRKTYITCWMNLRCLNRRKCFVGAQV